MFSLEQEAEESLLGISFIKAGSVEVLSGKSVRLILMSQGNLFELMVVFFSNRLSKFELKEFKNRIRESSENSRFKLGNQNGYKAFRLQTFPILKLFSIFSTFCLIFLDVGKVSLLHLLELQ